MAFCFSLILCINTFVLAQGEILNKINEEVWSKFCKSFETLDLQLMEEIHNKELYRIPADGRVILNYEEYMEGYRSWFAQAKKDNTLLNISLRFFERICNESSASERGIYRLTINEGRDNEQFFYGKFHVLLKKENDIWKILMDYDSNEGNTVGEKDFNMASAMDEVEKFSKK